MRAAPLLILLLVAGSLTAHTAPPPAPVVVHERDLPKYSPSGHTDTVNVRLVDRAVTDTYEMIHGTMAPGAVSDTPQHARELQVDYILSGEAQLTLAKDAPVTLRAGAVFRIPPGMPHRVVSTGTVPLEFVIIYSPPLP